MPARETRATRLLRQHGADCTLHEYSHDPRRQDYGDEAVFALGVASERVFKTLVADVDGTPVAAVIPVTGRLDLKALATACHGKRARMAEVATAERVTGYVAGGIAPLGHRSRLRVVLDRSAAEHPTIFCSAGRRGLEVELAPATLARLADATTAEITVATQDPAM